MTIKNFNLDFLRFDFNKYLLKNNNNFNYSGHNNTLLLLFDLSIYLFETKENDLYFKLEKLLEYLKLEKIIEYLKTEEKDSDIYEKIMLYFSFLPKFDFDFVQESVAYSIHDLCKRQIEAFFLFDKIKIEEVINSIIFKEGFVNILKKTEKEKNIQI